MSLVVVIMRTIGYGIITFVYLFTFALYGSYYEKGMRLSIKASNSGERSLFMVFLTDGPAAYIILISILQVISRRFLTKKFVRRIYKLLPIPILNLIIGLYTISVNNFDDGRSVDLNWFVILAFVYDIAFYVSILKYTCKRRITAKKHNKREKLLKETI